MTPYITPMRGRHVRLNADGREVSPHHADKEGVISGEGRDRQSWKIQFPGLKYPIGFHKSFVEIIEPQETSVTHEIRTADINGRSYAKLSEIKAGDKLEMDGGFTCMREGAVLTVQARDGELFVECADGGHALHGQADDGEHLIGMYRVGTVGE